MYTKIHNSRGRTVVAVCDEDLLGKTFEEGKLFLKVSKEFYGGERKDVEEAKAMAEDAIRCYIEGLRKENEEVPEEKEIAHVRISVKV